MVLATLIKHSKGSIRTRCAVERSQSINTCNSNMQFELYDRPKAKTRTTRSNNP
jgi:hypothetical protein